jgi:hypothetical protein
MSALCSISSPNTQLLRSKALYLGVQSFPTSRFVMASVSDTIKHDHRKLEEYYNNILAAKDYNTKSRWQNQFVWELARHSIAEELVVYPAIEKHIGTYRKEIAERDCQEHQVVYKPPVLIFLSTILFTTYLLTPNTGQRQTQQIPGPAIYKRRLRAYPPLPNVGP